MKLMKFNEAINDALYLSMKKDKNVIASDIGKKYLNKQISENGCII